ncbi:hypothetical protein DES49_1335 [Halospina denitrificans]|uniref:Uncharacterized protein n=1 Tax=Halospina denitrificans TaxID=332522 RepID=A0A4R7K0P4_9GAMM|nr:hypothetical protein [Halospina denitrificans]TDT43517.1 hypothetical protein DES49_1335 [Halospina denitrificans]
MSHHFAMCLKNEGYEASLEPRKLYEVLPDASAEKQEMIRVVDESGEDYLYPASWFIRMPLPESVEQQIASSF